MPGGVNFAIFSKHAIGMDLLLFDSPEAPHPSRVIKLDPRKNRTFYYWHVFVPGIGSGQVYGLRVHGVSDPARGRRFDGDKLLLDPYARAIVGWDRYSRAAAIMRGDNCPHALRSMVVDTSTYDWEGDAPLRTPYAKSVIYEMHVKGFTANPNSGVSEEKRGTFAGIIEKIPYLQELGVTAVELMPVQAFDPQDARPGLTNYWGYSSVSFFAPHFAYSSRRDGLGPIDEFRDMVKALHLAGIEVILDVVFNHTAEGDHRGPTLSFKGLDNSVYYILQDNGARYANYSGCGNTVKANHPVVGRLILDSLRYWVSEMHVDGFRFDLTSVLTRDTSGQPTKQPPTLWVIESDPILAGAKLIAEAWDAAGLYLVGSFVNLSDWFAEWNGPFRDDVRQFIKGDCRTVKTLAQRLTGSADIYTKEHSEPHRSINFISCHDGFTLNDLVSYNQKHNAVNGEKNADGTDWNFSWNCGVEGPSLDPSIEALRTRQTKNFLTVLFLSQGTPMLCMGDEVRRTQAGNNNAYCLDSELTWFDWSAIELHKGLLNFAGKLIALTRSLKILHYPRAVTEPALSRRPHLKWHGITPGKPDLSDDSHSLAFSLQDPDSREHIYVIFNAYWQPLTFALPHLRGDRHWCQLIDTAASPPSDIFEPEKAPALKSWKCTVEARSARVLMAR